jgi:hypothetical protein
MCFICHLYVLCLLFCLQAERTQKILLGTHITAHHDERPIADRQKVLVSRDDPTYTQYFENMTGQQTSTMNMARVLLSFHLNQYTQKELNDTEWGRLLYVVGGKISGAISAVCGKTTRYIVVEGGRYAEDTERQMCIGFGFWKAYEPEVRAVAQLIHVNRAFA